MRGRAFQFRMRLLALAAILLLALTPTFGRLAQAGAAQAGDAWAQLCTLTGMKLVKLPLAALDHPDALDSGQHDGGMDCDYCPLLAMLVLAVAALVLALLGFPRCKPGAMHAPRLRQRFHPSGLGSRGPPPSSEIAL